MAEQKTPRGDAERLSEDILLVIEARISAAGWSSSSRQSLQNLIIPILFVALDVRDAALREARAEIEGLQPVAELQAVLRGARRVLENAERLIDAARSSDKRPAGEVSGGEWRPGQHNRPELDALIQRSRAAYDAMTPEQQAAHDNAQRESFARSNVAIDRGPDARRTVSGPDLVAMIQRREDVATTTPDAEIPNAETGHGESCVDCASRCSSLAGNPNKWPVYLGDGWYHVGCIRKRMMSAAAERAAIVAWMRRGANGMFSPNEPEHGLLHAEADAIERGEHKQPKPDAGETE